MAAPAVHNRRSRMPFRGRFAGPALLFALALGCGSAATTLLTPAQLRDPETCRTCHPDQYAEWSGSMHAYASDDPVFRAMNKRAQRESALGDFCVKCHAPQALRDGLTTDGLNLDTVPAASRGVTCFFCHSAASVDGTHNDPLVLAQDGSLFGSFGDPVPGTPHA